MKLSSNMFDAIAAVFADQGAALAELSPIEAGDHSVGRKSRRPARRPPRPDRDGEHDRKRVLTLVEPHASLPNVVAQRVAEALAAPRGKDNWRVTRTLFDAGYVRCGTAQSKAHEAQAFDCYLRSDLVLHPSRCRGETRGVVAMSRLGTNGRFANQLFQYLYLKLYALRHELAAQVPPWDGAALFSLDDPQPAEGLLPLCFYAFDDDDLGLWLADDPPIDIDLEGYFQELPPCWEHHRDLVRRMFSHSPETRRKLDARVAGLTDGRGLVAVHVRRGDYPQLHSQGLTWYRPLPIAWYRDWLTEHRAEARDPVVYVATDAPEDIFPALVDFRPVGAASASHDLDLPPHLIDFEIMRRADHLAVANSSFSRMAAILAPDRQRAAIADFRTERFEPFDAWSDRRFWQRYAPSDGRWPAFGSGLEASRQRSVSLRLELGKARKTTDEIRRAHDDAHRDNVELRRAHDDAHRVNIDLQRAHDRAHGALIETQRAYDAQSHAIVDVQASQSALESKRDADAQRIRELTSANASLEAKAAAFESGYTERGGILDVMEGKVRSLRAAALERHHALASVRQTVKLVLTEVGALRTTRSMMEERLAASEHRFDEQLTLSAEKESSNSYLKNAVRAASERQKELERALDIARSAHVDAELAVRTAVFLGTPAGIARRVGFRPVIASISVGRKVAAALGWPLAQKLAADEQLLRERRYRHWLGLMRRRARRLVPGRPAVPMLDRPSVAEADAADSPKLLADWMRLAETPPARTSWDLFASKPSVVVVVPWLMQGGSETILLDVLKALSVHVDVSVVTTIYADHIMTDKFRPLVREIHHLNGSIDGEQAVAFLNAFLKARGTRLLLSSNASLVYREAHRLKEANPLLKVADILHNDLREGHFAAALAASPWIDHQVVVSPLIATSLRAEGIPDHRIEVIANGIDVADAFNPDRVTSRESRQALGLDDDEVVIGYIGRMSPEKRPLAFLDIVESLPDIPNLRVLMVGSGPLDAEVAARIQELAVPVTWLRHLQRADMGRVYASLDVLILSSTIEGMPLVVLEAMAMGVPVAATDVGNVSDLVEDGTNGFVRAVDDYQGLAGPVAELIADPERRAAMATAARQAIIDKGFTYSAMAERYVRLVQNCLRAS